MVTTDIPSAIWLDGPNPLLHWTSRQQRIGKEEWYLRLGKQTRGALWLPQLTALRKFPGLSARRGNPAEGPCTLWVRRGIWDSRETKAARTCRKHYLRKKNCTKRKHQRSAENPTWVCSKVMSVHIHEEDMAASVLPCQSRVVTTETMRSSKPKMYYLALNRKKIGNSWLTSCLTVKDWTLSS